MTEPEWQSRCDLAAPDTFDWMCPLLDRACEIEANLLDFDKLVRLVDRQLAEGWVIAEE